MRRNIVWDARHHDAPNGRVHLSSQVVHLDTGRPVYRRHRTFADRMTEFVCRIVLPLLAFTFAALAVIGLIAILLAIGRAIAHLGVALS